MDDVLAVLGVVGGILVTAGVLVALMGWGGMHERMPGRRSPVGGSRSCSPRGASCSWRWRS